MFAFLLHIALLPTLGQKRRTPPPKSSPPAVAQRPLPKTTTVETYANSRARHSTVFHHDGHEWTPALQGPTEPVSYRDSCIVIGVPRGAMAWFNLTEPITPSMPLSITSRFAIDSGDARGLLGIAIVTPSHQYLFGVTPQRRHSVLLNSRFDNYTQSIQRMGANPNDTRPQPFVAEQGALNTMTVDVTAQTITLTLNGTQVERWARDRMFSPLDGGIQAIAIFGLATTYGRVQSVVVDYGRRPIPDVDGAFRGTAKTIVPELNNRPYSRYPVIAPNGAEIFLVQNPRHQGDDDVAFAKALTDSTWTPSELIGRPINNQGANSVTAVSQDGNELFLWGRYLANGQPAAAGMSSTRRTADGWSLPQNVSIEAYSNASNTREETASPDRSVLILAAERSGETYGGKDLYVSFRRPDGSYTRPENLGPDVNSVADESTPYLAADGKTLYFSSNFAQDGFGDNDVFVSKRMDGTWTRWTPRTNLGRYVNTTGWDTYFTIHPSGRYAYMNTTVGGQNGIARLTLPQDSVTRTLLPDPVVVFTGRVLDARTKMPISTSIQYADLRTAEDLGSAISDPQSGRYSLVLPGGRSYGMHVSHPGYLPVSDHLLIDTLRAYTVVERDLELEPIAAGATIRLNNIFFDSDAAELRPESRAELIRIVEL
jgi:hypothetical protein